MKTTMKHLLLSFCLCLVLAGAATAQELTAKGAKSDEINAKIHEVDMLMQILPLLLTKDQLNDKILPAIEKNRATFRKELEYEDGELAKLEPMLDEALTGAYDKGSYPARKSTGDIADKTYKLGLQRQIIVSLMTDAMIDTVNTTLNAGQKKALLGSFDPKFIDPSAKPETITDDRKLKFFVQRIFLDPTTYEILKKMARLAK
jgi:hypothetical protein